MKFLILFLWIQEASDVSDETRKEIEVKMKWESKTNAD